MSFIRRKYDFEESPVIAAMGGFQSLFRGALARQGFENELRGDFYRDALNEGRRLAEEQLVPPAYDSGFAEGRRIGKSLGHFKGTKEFALHGNKYVVVSETGYQSYKTLPELLENTEFRAEVANQVNKKYEKTPFFENLRKEEQKLADEFNKTKMNLQNQESSFTSALGHIKERSRIRKNQNLVEKNKFLQDILSRNTNESIGTFEGKQQLNRDVTAYKTKYPADWIKLTPKTHAANIDNYFKNYDLSERLHRDRVAKRAEIDQERAGIRELQEKRRVNIMDATEGSFRETLRNELGITNFDTIPFILGDTRNVYNIENYRQRANDGLDKLLEKKPFVDWRQNKSMAGFKKMDDLLFMPKPMIVKPYTPAPDTIQKMDQMILSSTQKYTPYKPTLREEIARSQQTIPRLTFGDETPPTTPTKAVTVVRKNRTGKK